MLNPKPPASVLRLLPVMSACTTVLLLAGSIWWAQGHLGDGFLPHGYCLTWIPGLLWLHVASDSLIALAYLTIPLTLLYFIRRRSDVPFGWMLVLFGSFIVACGATHAFDVWTLWHADYWLSGGVKVLTAGISVATAAALVLAMPKALAIPSIAQLQAAKDALEAEVRARVEAESALRQAQADLEERVRQRTGELAHANAMLDAVFVAAPMGLVLFDAQDRYVRINPALAAINGAPVEQHLGRTVHELLPALADTIASQLAQVRSTGAPLLGVEVQGVTPARPEPSVFRVSYFPVGSLPLVGAVCEDVTDRLAAERERSLALQEARDANRLKNEFMARVSHELRTPLQTMMSSLTLLQTREMDAAATQRTLERLDRNVRMQARMIADLLDVSRLLGNTLSIDSRPTDPAEAVRRALDTFDAAARDKGVALDWQEDGAPSVAPGGSNGTVMADAQRLEQVVNNLLGNAVKYTPAGGHVTVSTAWTDDAWTLRVRDDGIGIGAADLPIVFQPFRRGSDAAAGRQQGLGLGLAIARNIVDLLRGRIDVFSAGRGQGAEFSVRLPRLVDAAAAVGLDAEPGALPSLHGLRVLLVEDEPDLAESMAAALRMLGAGVRVADTPDTAAAQLLAEGSDVLLSDLRLAQGTTGFDVLLRLRALQPGLPAVAMSAFGSEADLAATAAAGFRQHLVKPVPVAAVARAVHAAWQGGAAAVTPAAG